MRYFFFVFGTCSLFYIRCPFFCFPLSCSTSFLHIVFSSFSSRWYLTNKGEKKKKNCKQLPHIKECNGPISQSLGEFGARLLKEWNPLDRGIQRDSTHHIAETEWGVKIGDPRGLPNMVSRILEDAETERGIGFHMFTLSTRSFSGLVLMEDLCLYISIVPHKRNEQLFLS